MEIYEATGIIIIAMSLLYYKLSKEIENQGTIRSTQLRMMEEGLRDNIWRARVDLGDEISNESEELDRQINKTAQAVVNKLDKD